jgi:hypothetical protein
VRKLLFAVAGSILGVDNFWKIWVTFVARVADGQVRFDT